MTTQPMQKHASGLRPSTPGSAADAVTLLARKLIKQAIDCCPPTDGRRPYADGTPEIILDLATDGMRCLLIRLPVHDEMPHSAVALSPRELEIARMIAKGYPNKTIAAVLEISAWTVCAHIRRVFAKLGVGSRAAMVARLLDEGSFGETGESKENAEDAERRREIHGKKSRLFFP